MRPTFANLVCLLLSLGLALAAPRLRAQGTLAPPAGPPAPTIKTLDQLEPGVPVQSLSGVTSVTQYQISKPGRYYLTGDIHGVAGLLAIQVTTGPVTLDMKGYSVSGVPGASVGIEGGFQFTIRNGLITGWGSDGLNTSSDSFIENLTVTHCGLYGIDVQGSSTIRNCHASFNYIGVNFNGNGVIEDSQVFQNTNTGIQIGAGRVERCYVNSNGGNGIAASSYGQIVNNNVSFNQLGGISVSSDAQVAYNEINNNGSGGSGSTAAGIYLYGSNNHAAFNHLAGNKYGIVAINGSSSNTVNNNVVIHSTSGNYSGNTGNNVASWGPIVTSLAAATNPFSNISLP